MNTPSGHHPSSRLVRRLGLVAAMSVALTVVPAFGAAHAGAQAGSEPAAVPAEERVDTTVIDEDDPGPTTDTTDEEARRRANGWRRLTSARAVVGNYGAVSIRLVNTTGVETLRAPLKLIAAELSDVTGLKVSVASGTVSSFTPLKGEVRVRVSNSASCTGAWIGCGGPSSMTSIPSGDWLIRSGTATIRPSALTTLTAAELRILLSHELGHAFNLAHFNAQYGGQYQVMRTPLTTRPAKFGNGDGNGLRTMTPFQTRRAYDLDCDGTRDQVTYDGRNLKVTKSSNGARTSTDWGQWFDRVLLPGDMDGDLMPDVLGVTPAGQLYLLQGSCNAKFPNYSSAKPGGTYTQKALAASRDFTGDGKSDLFVLAADGRLLMKSWNGTGFGNWVQLATGWTNVTALSMSGDRNGDGHDDLYARRADGSLWAYWGNGRGGFTNPAGQKVG